MNSGKRFRWKQVLEPAVDHFRNIKISRKLALLYIGAVTVCIVALGVFYYISIRDYVQGNTSELLTRTLKQARSNIEYKISMYDKFSESMSTNRKIQDIIKGSYEDPIDKYEVNQQLFGQLDLVFKSYADMSTLNLYITNLTLPNYKDLQITINTCSEEELSNFTTDMNARTKWVYDTPEMLEKGLELIPPIEFASRQQEPQLDEPAGKLYAARKILNMISEGDLGLIKIDLNINNFFGGIKTPGIEDRGWMDVVDGDLNIIYSGLGSDGPKDEPPIDWRKEAGLFDGTDKSKIVRVGNTSYVMVYDVLKDVDWKIICVLPIKEYFANVDRMRIVTLIAVILCIILFSTISGFIAAKVTRKIVELSDSMEKIQVGNFNVHIPYRGQDEVGHLINGFNKMAVKLEDLVREVYVIQVKEKEAELKALQAQINPHFLYNTLASISWLGMRNQEKDITRMSNSLAKFYKVSLSKGRNIITVRDEIEHVRAYMDIQSIRYKNKINMSYDVDEELLDTFTIKLILQPFIENAIMHGIWKEKEHINIRLTVQRDGNNVLWQIIDDGTGIGADRQQQLLLNSDDTVRGYGIVNVDQRIKIFYGDQYGVTLFSRAGIGTVISVVTPVSLNGENGTVERT